MLFSELPTWIIIPFLFLLGISVGSFLNVLIDRLPQGTSITGRSHCDHCNRQLNWIDLFPLLSYLFLGGKCRTCKKKIPARYFFVELLTGVMFVMVWFTFPSSVILGSPAESGMTPESIISRFWTHSCLTCQNDVVYKLLLFGLLSSLTVIFFTDAKYQMIPDTIQGVLLIFSLSLLLFYNLNPSQWVIRIRDGIAIMLPLLLLFLITKGRGMGFGDVKLAFTIGLLLGLWGGLLALYIAFMSGALVGIHLLFTGRKKMKQTIAFGPFLVIGIIIALFWGNQIMEWVRRWYGV